MTGGVPNGVHPMREIAARGRIDDDDIRRHREQPVGEPVAVTRGAGDVKLERRTLHRLQRVNRVAGDVTRREHGDYTEGTGRASSVHSVAAHPRSTIAPTALSRSSRCLQTGSSRKTQRSSYSTAT